MVSIKDIAREMGVSISTVSKALNDYADVSVEMRQAVRQTADRMGYRADFAAKSLRSKRSYHMALVTDDMSPANRDQMRDVFDSFRNTAWKKGYMVTALSVSELKQEPDVCVSLKKHGIGGLLLATNHYDQPYVQELLQGEIPLVTVDYILNDHSSVISDYAGGVQTLVKKAAALGHQRVACVYDGSLPAQRRNVITALSAENLPTSERLMIPVDAKTPQSAAEATRQLLALSRRPTCILYMDDYCCLAGLDVLRQTARTKKISAAGFGGAVTRIFPEMTTVSIDTEKIGRSAALILMDAMESPNSYMPMHVTVDMQFREGTTLGESMCS